MTKTEQNLAEANAHLAAVTQQHTPTPLRKMRVSDNKEPSGVWSYLQSFNEKWQTWEDCGVTLGDEELKTVMHQVATACNAHDDLVALAEKIMVQFPADEGFIIGSMAEAALAKAKAVQS